MYNICIFAGTTEGRKLADFLSRQRVSVTVCVATEYGENLIKPSSNLTVLAERLSCEDMKELFFKENFDLVIDSTHPYAAEVTENIEVSCKNTDTEYIRLLRRDSDTAPGAVFVSDADEAVDYLNNTEGNIFLTTGSKEIEKYTGIRNFEQRLYVRILPNEMSMDACKNAGIKQSHIIAMQGPFSQELNEAMLNTVFAKYLVTKDGGSYGGFESKIRAAVKSGTQVIVIGRPEQKKGLNFSDIIDLLCSRFDCVYRPKVAVIGIGAGCYDNMTIGAEKAIQRADCIIGAKRMIALAASPKQAVYEAFNAEKIADFIKTNRDYQKFVVLMSGDTGFFSGTKKLLPLLEGFEVEVLPGISSLAYLCSKIGKSYEDAVTVSLHGRNCDIVSCVRKNREVFALMGGENCAGELCRLLKDSGLGYVKVYIGERLGYDDERIIKGTAEEFSAGCYDKLSSVFIENEHTYNIAVHGLSDDSFIRQAEGERVVPMTKSEVRSVCLSKLMITEDAVCWDIGVGTGSVSVEMALKASKGMVYAVECKDTAARLAELNRKKFLLENLNIIKGTAPEICRDIPRPTHVFIGGSSGNMKEIIELILEKNPNTRIVATAISLETISELNGCMKEFRFEKTEVVSLAVARSKKTGEYNLMNAQNPIYIFTMQNGGESV